MQIRKVRPDEASVLQDLNNEVMVDNSTFDPDLVPDWAYSEAGKKYFQDLVTDPDSICFVAEDHGNLVGYLAASPKPISYRKSYYLEIDNMGILPAYRSKGIGRMLMDTCKKWAKENGYQKMIVNSYAKNEKAVGFYQKCGFEVIDVSLEILI